MIARLTRLGEAAEIPVGIERPNGRLVDLLLEAGHPVVPVSPNAIKTWRDGEVLSGAKSDAGDEPGSLLGLAPGRTDSCVRDWLAAQSEMFRQAVEIVVIDPSAPYASGIRAALPAARIAVEKWHLVALANAMVTEVRQRVTRDQLGRRGRKSDQLWVNRKLLLTGAEHLAAKQWQRFTTMLEALPPFDRRGLKLSWWGWFDGRGVDAVRSPPDGNFIDEGGAQLPARRCPTGSAPSRRAWCRTSRAAAAISWDRWAR